MNLPSHFLATILDDTPTMTEDCPASRFILLTLPVVVLLGYGWFIVSSYWPFLNFRSRLRSPDLAGLPEDVVGFGFWMWWPFVALIFAVVLTSAVLAVERRVLVAVLVLSPFVLLSVADYHLCDRLVQELVRGGTPLQG